MKLNNKIIKIVVALALFIGVMSVFAGSKVLMGIEGKPYNILNWLVVYNVIFGVISIVTSVLIWIQHSWFKKFVVFVLSAHFLVLLYLQFFNETVASESIKAMLFRVSVWVLIFALAIYPKITKKTEIQNSKT